MPAPDADHSAANSDAEGIGPGAVTRLVNAMGAPGEQLDNSAFQSLYAELKRLASHYLSAEHDRGVLQTTALVHEALLRLGQWEESQTWQNRAHFFGAAAIAMRRILVNEARRRRVAGRALRLIAGGSGGAAAPAVELIDLDEALAALERHDPGLARLVELRVFGGATTEQAAMMLDRSVRSIGRDWKIARAWLLRWLTDHGRTESGRPR